MPSKELERKYRKHRSRLLFTPFRRVEARRIWGAKSPIELFLIQELARRGQFPQLQILIMEGGAAFPSWYHLWKDLEFRHAPGLITEADLYFRSIVWPSSVQLGQAPQAPKAEGERPGDQ